MCAPISGWETICPQVVVSMKHFKAERLYQERRNSLLRAFGILQNTFRDFKRSNVTGEDIWPRSIDVCLEPEVRNLLDGTMNNISIQDLSQQLMSYSPSICARWRESIDLRLSAYMSYCTRFRRGANKFKLASAIFKCTACGKVLWYPAVLTHGCLHAFLPTPKTHFFSADYDELAAHVCRRLPFSLNVLDLNAWSELIDKVIQLCGLNPKTATYDQADRAHARLTCKSCNEYGRRNVMTWRTAVSFQASFILGNLNIYPV